MNQQTNPKRNPFRSSFCTSLAINLAVLLLIGLWSAAHQQPREAHAQGSSEMAVYTNALAVDSIFDHGSSLAVDSHGRPHVSFVEEGTTIGAGQRLRYASEFEPGLWRFEVLTNWGDLVGYATSLALDDAGNPHIAFTHNGRLKYANKIDGTWQIEPIDNVISSGDALAMLLDSSGQPHIVSSGGGVWYAHRYEQGWQTSEIPKSGADDRYVTLALDSDDHPHVGFMSEFVDPAEAVHGTLHYTYQDGDDWQIEDVDFGGGGWYPALALDSMGRAYFSYQSGGSNESGSNYELSYAKRSTAAPAPGEWQIAEVDEDGEGQSMLLLDADGRPHISYTAIDRMYATKDEVDWQKMEVDYRFGQCISDENWSLDSIERPVLSCVNEGMEVITWSPMSKYVLWTPLVRSQ